MNKRCGLFIFPVFLFSLLCFIFASCSNNKNSNGHGRSSKDGFLKDGTYNVQVSLEGGSGRSKLNNPNLLFVENGKCSIKLVWSSKNYDYMIVDGSKYFNENAGGDSTFTFPVSDISKSINIIADTVAMSVPHEVEYVLSFEVLSSVSNDVDFSSINFSDSVDLKFASKFSIKKSDSYSLINISDEDSFLLVSENVPVPVNCPENIIVLKQPLNKTYLVSSPVMDFFVKLNLLDYVKFCGTKAKDWFIPEAASFMNDNKILFAGKYSSPDYELLYSSGCNLAIENTMAYHKPEVIEKLQELGIPVLIEKSAYEDHPLGRLEWIKLYGVLFGKEKEAFDFFDEQVSRLENISGASSGKSVVFFYITSNGSVNIRKPTDYISKMINLAGGSYALSNISVDEDNALSTMNMQFENFYLEALNADIIVYNSIVDGKIYSIDDLLKKNAMLADFKAVKNGNVYCTENYFYQKTSGFLDFITDINKVCNGCEDNLFYLCKVN